MSILNKIANWIARITSILILAFLFAFTFSNVKLANATVRIADVQAEINYFSFHKEIPETAFKVFENDLENCCKNGDDLVDYRSWGISIEAVAAKGGVTAVEEGGLNLFKFGSKEATSSTGWKSGDRFLKMFDQGSPKLNWKQNSGFLRREMGAGNPIFDSFALVGVHIHYRRRPVL